MLEQESDLRCLVPSLIRSVSSSSIRTFHLISFFSILAFCLWTSFSSASFWSNQWSLFIMLMFTGPVWGYPIDPASPLVFHSVYSVVGPVWWPPIGPASLGWFIVSSLLLGQSDGIQASLPLCWGFMIYSLLLGQSEGIQASLCDLVGLILSANLLGHPVGISTSLPGFVGFYRIGYTDINI